MLRNWKADGEKVGLTFIEKVGNIIFSQKMDLPSRVIEQVGRLRNYHRDSVWSLLIIISS